MKAEPKSVTVSRASYLKPNAATLRLMSTAQLITVVNEDGTVYATVTRQLRKA